MVKHMSIKKNESRCVCCFPSPSAKNNNKRKENNTTVVSSGNGQDFVFKPVCHQRQCLGNCLFKKIFTSGNVQGAPARPNMSHFGPGFGDEIVAKHVIYSLSVGIRPHKWPPVTVGPRVSRPGSSGHPGTQGPRVAWFQGPSGPKPWITTVLFAFMIQDIIGNPGIC